MTSRNAPAALALNRPTAARVAAARDAARHPRCTTKGGCEEAKPRLACEEA
jgi:hypothetical protein